MLKCLRTLYNLFLLKVLDVSASSKAVLQENSLTSPVASVKPSRTRRNETRLVITAKLTAVDPMINSRLVIPSLLLHWIYRSKTRVDIDDISDSSRPKRIATINFCRHIPNFTTSILHFSAYSKLTMPQLFSINPKQFIFFHVTSLLALGRQGKGC